MIKSAINTVLFTTLMLGGIAPNTGNFIEDDTDFNKTFSKGWGWLTVNSANAGSREQSEVETLAVYGAPPEYEWNYYGNSGEDNTGLFEDSLGGSDGGGGSDGSEEEERLKKRQDCKIGLETSLRETKNALLLDYRTNTSTCNNYHYLATASGIVGAVAAVPTFGFTAAAGMSGAVSFATAGVICQQNADGRYAELIAYNESVTREFDLKVCDQI